MCIRDRIKDVQESEENLYLPLSEELLPGKSLKISLNYTLNLPSPKFTNYGTDRKIFRLKYFFIVPDGFENADQPEKNYIDIEETQNPGNFWTVNLEIPTNLFSKSNLNEIHPKYFSGKLNEDP